MRMTSAEYNAGRHQANDDMRHQCRELCVRDYQLAREMSCYSLDFLLGYAEILASVPSKPAKGF